ncbi:hypothetical protein HELRODRAFT_99594, partial [Helobdella robusta]|uniref:Uncharacterized protein n=1 Tax=Helobdella robusta TaxID=6412 RepID=T1G9T9_HELRO
MDGGRKVWVPDPTDGFKLGIIKDINSEWVSVELTSGSSSSSFSPSHKNEVKVNYNEVYPSEEYENKDVEDNCALMYLNEATLLNNVRVRYLKDSIYTYVANILIALNPYKGLNNLYDKSSIESYQGKSLGTRPPHVFAIADKAYRDMKHFKESQSIVVSGESGAGKTESTKYILKYLTESWGSKAGPIEQRIVESNPLLEAFGNAKTMRNNNSSRFGKFVEIHFDSKNQVCGGYISHYLLEKSRVCIQSSGERNYHIFYRLCAGAPASLRSMLKVENPDDFHYLRKGCTQFFCNDASERSLVDSQKSCNTKKQGTLRDITLNDVTDFNLTDSALSHMGISDRLKLEIYRVIAGVLHLGNVAFEDPPAEDTTGGCQVAPFSIPSLEVTSILLGCDKDELKAALTSRMMVTSFGGRRGSAILVPLKTNEAQNARDALAKSVYAKLFDYIVLAVNQSLPFSQSVSYIGLLDIAGFEYFQTNSFEQFCINYCNEKLQQFFNERILKEEQALYEKEDLKVKKIHYIDNQDCIDLIESRTNGIFSILDEENKLPKPLADHFTSEVHRLNKDHARLNIPRKSKLKAHREILDNEGFLIRHFAGAVCYETAQFIDKNNDALHYSLESLILNSKSVFLKSLYELKPDLSSSSSSSSLSSSSSSLPSGLSSSPSSGKLAFSSVGSKFQSQLSLLMEKLRSTGTSFIRCIKPNSKMAARCFEGTQILTQLQCSGMPSVLDLMHQGFPSRTPFSELYNMYKQFMPANIARLDPRLFCKALFKALGLQETDYKFGMTKIFFRPGKFAEFDQLIKSDKEHLDALIQKVQKWLIGMRWRRVQWTTWATIRVRNLIGERRKKFITIQSLVKMWRVKKEYAPRISCIRKIRSLYVQLDPMTQMTLQLKEGQEVARQKIAMLKSQMGDVIKKLQTSPTINQSELNSISEMLMGALEGVVGELKKLVEEQQMAEERERVRKMQEQISKEKEKREAEERGRQEEERRKMVEEKARRLKEEEEEKSRREEEMKRLHESTNTNYVIIVTRRPIRQQLQEQDRRDRELALRLAAEDSSQVEDLARWAGLPAKHSSVQKKPGSVTSSSTKPDFTQWKYADLRDTINTSCNLDLLESCREEVHRRLMVYHEWRLKNRASNKEERAPQSVMDIAQNPYLLEQFTSPVLLKEQRYFRIPFKRSNEPNGPSYPISGWWLAHFDGNWVARQMELHPGKAPVLLVAGADDIRMCELSLTQSGLVRRQGAEVTEAVFDEVWS